MTALALILAMTLGADLSRVELPTLDAIRAERARRAPVWTPQVGPQTVAFNSKAHIVGYGGAAGGGKSDLIVGLALTQHRRSIIFRREHTEVRDLFQRAEEIVELAGAKFKSNRGLSTINLPTGDRQLEFGGIKNTDDWRKYRGRAKDGYFFDEATEFDELMIRSLIGWNRTTVPGQRCRVVLTFNPPGVKHGQWLINFFGPWLNPQHPNPAQYGELRWFTTINGTDIECPSGDAINVCGECGSFEDGCGHDPKFRERVIPLSRTFIKALLDDNAYLKDTTYRATLMGLPEPLRSQLLYGDFEAEYEDDAYQVIPTKWVQLAQERWMERDRPTAPVSAVGGDIARGGPDRTCFGGRIGNWFDELEAIPGRDTPTGRKAIERLTRYVGERGYKVVGPLLVGMDVIAVGSSPQDVATEEFEGKIQLCALNGAEAADENFTDKSGLLHFINKRAQWYWQLRDALDPESGQDYALPPDRELLADLCAPRYELTPRGIKIEDKDEIRKRLGRSPDKGDTLVYANAARPLIVGYQSVEKRATPAGNPLARSMGRNWKSKRGL